MRLDRLSNGERISGVSAILLYVFMLFNWFGVEGFSDPNNSLLIDMRGSRPGESAWEALDYIPIILLIAIVFTLAVATLRLTNVAHRPPATVNAVIALLGLASMLVILFRILDSPNFGTEGIMTFEGTVQFPIFLALFAAGGIVLSGGLAMREEGFSLSDLRARHGGIQNRA